MARKRGAALIGVCCALVVALAGCRGGRLEVGATSGSSPPPQVSAADGSEPNSLIQGSDGNLYGTAHSGGRYGQGVLFRLTPAGAQTVLYSFAGGASDGAGPEGLIQGSDGNFYGTTAAGGPGGCSHQPEAGGGGEPPSGCGTVFQVTPSGAESIVYFFSGASDGGAPNAGLVQGSDGDFYGTADAGGASGNGVVFQLTLGGVETVLHSFAGGNADGAQPAGLILGSDGALYGVTTNGGASNLGTVFSLTVAGTETLLHAFAGGIDGALPAAPPTQGTDGNLYGTTASGGAPANASPRCQRGCGTVFKVTPAGVETVIYAFGGGNADGASPYAALIEGSDGSFYGSTSAGGNASCSGGCGTAFKISAAGVETVLHYFGATSTDGIEPVTPLIQIADGDFYGTTGSGGQLNYGTVFTMTPMGTETVLFFFGSTANP
jgi:uncharacterized repeat protein (TIGR03803 family)